MQQNQKEILEGLEIKLGINQTRILTESERLVQVAAMQQMQLDEFRSRITTLERNSL